MSEQLHTVQQAAERLKLHPKTVLRLIREGRLRGARIGKSYRIRESDLDAFAGIAAGDGAASLRARITCVAEIEELSRDAYDRIAGPLGAVFVSDEPGREPVHATTAYDPQARSLKVVLIAAPADAAQWLKLLQALLEHVRG